MTLVSFAMGQEGQKMKQISMQFQKEIRKTVSAAYLLYLPKDYERDVKKKWPLMLFLHGSGERGKDIEMVKRHGPPKLIGEGREFEFVVVSPQCPDNEDWTNDVLIALVDEIVRSYRIDEVRVYLTGLSMGGWGTWNLALEYPERFAAIAPICARTDRNNPAKASRLTDIPIWVFHGALDNVVPITESGRIVEALRVAGANVKFTVYPEAGHDSWTETYNNADFYRWLLAQHKKSRR